jgi:hypothetical protein
MSRQTYKCRVTGMWVRGANVRVRYALAADSAINYRGLSGPTLLEDSEVIGVR